MSKYALTTKYKSIDSWTDDKRSVTTLPSQRMGFQRIFDKRQNTKLTSLLRLLIVKSNQVIEYSFDGFSFYIHAM